MLTSLLTIVEHFTWLIKVHKSNQNVSVFSTTCGLIKKKTIEVTFGWATMGLSAPLRSWVQIPSSPSTPFYSQFWFKSDFIEKSTKINKKRSGLAHFFKKTLFRLKNCLKRAKCNKKRLAMANQIILYDLTTFELWCTPCYTDKRFLRFFMPVLVANWKCDWCQFHWLRGAIATSK